MDKRLAWFEAIYENSESDGHGSATPDPSEVFVLVRSTVRKSPGTETQTTGDEAYRAICLARPYISKRRTAHKIF